MLFVVYFVLGMSDGAKGRKASASAAKASTERISPRSRSPPVEEDSKRARVHGNGNGDGSDRDGELSSMFNKLKAQITDEVRSISETINTKNMGHIETTIRAIDKNHSKRMDALESEVSDIRSSQFTMQSSHDKLREEVEALRKGLAASESSVASNKWIDESQFDRLPAPHVIRLNTESLVSLQSISSMVNLWFADASLEPKHFSIQGGPSPLSRNFRITLKGEEGLASRRATKALDALRLENGAWTELYCKSPNGSSTRAYAGPDKNPKQMATERLTKKLLASCRESLGSASWGASKRDGIVTLDGLRIVKICPKADKSHELLLDNSLVRQYNLDKANIQAAFEGLAALVGDTTVWAP